MESKNPYTAAQLYSDRRCLHLCSAQTRFNPKLQNVESTSVAGQDERRPPLCCSMYRVQKNSLQRTTILIHIIVSTSFHQPNKHKHIKAERNWNVYLYIQTMQKLVEISSAIGKYSIPRNKIEFKLPCCQVDHCICIFNLTRANNEFSGVLQALDH